MNHNRKYNARIKGKIDIRNAIFEDNIYNIYNISDAPRPHSHHSHHHTRSNLPAKNPV